MEVKRLFEGVYSIDGKLATENLDPGRRVYGEVLVSYGGKEYRLWNPYRSKLAAAIINGLKNFKLSKGSKVLYLGAATGTTSSHVSDIASQGQVFCVELSERNMRDLIKVCERRRNMLPILADANNTDRYSKIVGTCDIIYQDVSARDQAAILNKNSSMLKP
ncbi:MAG: fibrillarin-like rRNA/tRNA 2'-O-methyltransferase, partial [Candidatus Micrarchaeaceae archaeon]